MDPTPTPARAWTMSPTPSPRAAPRVAPPALDHAVARHHRDDHDDDATTSSTTRRTFFARDHTPRALYARRAVCRHARAAPRVGVDTSDVRRPLGEYSDIRRLCPMFGHSASLSNVRTFGVSVQCSDIRRPRASTTTTTTTTTDAGDDDGRGRRRRREYAPRESATSWTTHTAVLSPPPPPL